MQFSTRVLGVHEEGHWCVIALEMSLRGYGSTFNEALENLHDTIEAQVSFALQHDTLDSIWKPAEPHYVELYQSVRNRSMRHYLESSEEDVGFNDEAEYVASDLPLPRSNHSPYEALA